MASNVPCVIATPPLGVDAPAAAQRHWIGPVGTVPDDRFDVVAALAVYGVRTSVPAPAFAAYVTVIAP